MVVFMTTIFALWSGIGDGLAALVIVQAEMFASASRELVKSVISYFKCSRILKFGIQGVGSIRVGFQQCGEDC